MNDWGLLSLLPLAVTLVLAFLTRSALIAMLIGAFVGTLMLGTAPGEGLNELLQRSLGTGDFIWICQIVILIGVLFELFKRAGVLGGLARRFVDGQGSRRTVEVSAWGMGFVIVDDYFSPLLTGAVMRPMSVGQASQGRNSPSSSIRRPRPCASSYRSRPGERICRA